jgi:hypothetical protein
MAPDEKAIDDPLQQNDAHLSYKLATDVQPHMITTSRICSTPAPT